MVQQFGHRRLVVGTDHPGRLLITGVPLGRHDRQPGVHQMPDHRVLGGRVAQHQPVHLGRAVLRQMTGGQQGDVQARARGRSATPNTNAMEYSALVRNSGK